MTSQSQSRGGGAPILMSGPMVRATLEGRKTQTRRVIKPVGKVGSFVMYPHYINGKRNGESSHPEFADLTAENRGVPLYGGTTRFFPGQLLWVRESADPTAIYFRPIQFGEGKYAAGTDGVIYRREGDEWVRCASQATPKGYEEISLRHRGDHRRFRVNRLVAEAYYGPAPTGHVCRHMDGRRSNNRPENLDWGTSAQNSTDAAAAGSFSGENGSQSKLTVAEVAAIRASNDPQAILAERFGITQPTVSKIKNGKKWASPPEAPPRNLPEWRLWRSPRYCPRWASRLTLEVTAVKVERLNSISADDAMAEGIETFTDHGMRFWKRYRDGGWNTYVDCPIGSFASLWTEINGPGSWEANPWIVAVSFTPHRQNIDQFTATRSHIGDGK